MVYACGTSLVCYENLVTHRQRRAVKHKDMLHGTDSAFEGYFSDLFLPGAPDTMHLLSGLLEG